MSLKTVVRAEIDRLKAQKQVVAGKLVTAKAEVDALDFLRDQINADIAECQVWLDANGG